MAALNEKQPLKGLWAARIDRPEPTPLNGAGSETKRSIMDDVTNCSSPCDRTTTDRFKPARFAAELSLPPADESLLIEARAAVRQEFRKSSKWKRLRCRKVSVIAEQTRGTVYAVHVGSSVDFDWTWEGATAFRPQALEVYGETDVDLADFEDTPVEDVSLWSGEILEVDERGGCLFIKLNNPEFPPTVGSFFVRSFEFLNVLDAIYHEPRFEAIRSDLPSRLAAATGNIYPQITPKSSVGLPQLREWWNHAWSILWGPPGTGKTYTTGQQVARILADDSERVLVVSTTNRATDAVALSIGKAASSICPRALDAGEIRRIGKGASYRGFAEAGLEAMLQGTESEVLSQIDTLAQQLRLFDSWDDKALTRKQIAELRSRVGDQSKRTFVDSAVRVVVATVFKAMNFLDQESVRRMLEQGEAPFTTVFIDEAGLISRAAVAALSLLASRRVVLVGDSKQLAPISGMSRLLSTRQLTWLAESGLSHLEEIQNTAAAVHVLHEQRRMHPDVCKVVSEYQYAAALTTAPEVTNRESKLPSLFRDASRAIWYVLDEDAATLATLRAERGPGNKSWVRSITPDILEKLFLDRSMRQARGLFISPYKAQVQAIGKWLTAAGITGWEASTVHSQQGSEADVVVFDTVNAGNCNWPFDEWKRLVNVALSRAREAVVVLASRSEMEEPFLRPLLSSLSPCTLEFSGGRVHWTVVDAVCSTRRPSVPAVNGNSLGGQIAKRKAMRPVLSQEQQRLSNLELDGKPRLVRGVAGSGKTLVLSNWLAKTVRRTASSKDRRIWAVYANRSLHKLLRTSIESAWASDAAGAPFPWDCVSLLHVRDVLAELLPSVSLSLDAFEFDYDRAAAEFLERHQSAAVLPRCNALFIDEAQDMGPSTLKLLLSLVQQSDASDHNSRSAHIFFDNAQNIYGRGTPKWSEFGLDMRGRSTIMKESFRSTTPITELAVNVLHRLSPIGEYQDLKELLSLGLIERTERKGEQWLKVRFNQVEGPKPVFRSFGSRQTELQTIARDLKRLIVDESVSPADICLIYNGRTTVEQLQLHLAPAMAEVGVELSVQKNRSFERQPNTLLVTTSHSFKGYDAEVVMIPCADQYTTQENEVLAANLYVAMTRARSLLAIYATTGGNTAAQQLISSIEDCVSTLRDPPVIEKDESPQDDLYDILEQIGHQHRKWLISLWNAFQIVQEPIFGSDGQVVAEPLFWFARDGKRFACVLQGHLASIDKAILQAHGITLCIPGGPLE